MKIQEQISRLKAYERNGAQDYQINRARGLKRELSGYTKPLYPSAYYSRQSKRFGKDEAVAKWLYEHQEQKRFLEGGF